MGLHANDLGRLYAVAYALLLFVWWESKNQSLKAALMATMGVATLAMVLTFSRGAFMGFLIVNALFLVWKFNAKTLSLALLAAALVALIAPEYLWNRITFGFDADANRVSADRIDGIWLPLLPELWKAPPWGNGLGSIMWSVPMLTDSMLVVGHPHSAYLEALLDMGIVGLGLMLAYYWHVWRGFRTLGGNAYLSPEMRGFFQGAAAALVCFLVTGWVGSSFRPDAEFSFLWVAIGMMYGTFARRPAS
jgi:O-antigen ligase